MKGDRVRFCVHENRMYRRILLHEGLLDDAAIGPNGRSDTVASPVTDH